MANTAETKVFVAGWGNTKRNLKFKILIKILFFKLFIAHCDSSIIWKITHPKIPERLQYGRVSD